MTLLSRSRGSDFVEFVVFVDRSEISAVRSHYAQYPEVFYSMRRGQFRSAVDISQVARVGDWGVNCDGLKGSLTEHQKIPRRLTLGRACFLCSRCDLVPLSDTICFCRRSVRSSAAEEHRILGLEGKKIPFTAVHLLVLLGNKKGRLRLTNALLSLVTQGAEPNCCARGRLDLPLHYGHPSVPLRYGRRTCSRAERPHEA
ncbi:hypothetical protein K438DRAFT_87665 [Mycena galopus ATCC 62051]|nr:hypothetical protein K438DRAFT_87665 [Mycena galopus ATCC 62051]